MRKGKARIIDLNPSPDLAYIAGVVIGDGTLLDKKYDYAIRLRVKDYDFAKTFSEVVSIFLGREPYPVTRYEIPEYGTFYIVQAYSKQLNLFLRQGLDGLKDVVWQYPQHFLRGLFDSDGSVHFAWEGNRLCKMVCFHSSNLPLVNYVKKLLESMGITSHARAVRTGEKRMRDGHMLVPKKPISYILSIIDMNSIRIFAENICFTISRKKEKLSSMLEEMSRIKRWTKEADDFLIENYQSMRYEDIARILGKSERAVRQRRFVLCLPRKGTDAPSATPIGYTEEERG